MSLIPADCPMCGRAVVEIDASRSEGETIVRGRCRSRRCSDQPIVTYRITAGRVERLQLVDRGTHRRVR